MYVDLIFFSKSLASLVWVEALEQNKKNIYTSVRAQPMLVRHVRSFLVEP